jgi:hypothetical protein
VILPEKVLDTEKYTLRRFRVMSQTKFNNSKLGQDRVTVFALLIYPIISICLQSFLFISLIVSELCPRQSPKCKYEQIAISPKLGKVELWFMCSDLPVRSQTPHSDYLPWQNCKHCLHMMMSHMM